jgi:hypothetical protein
VTTTDKFQLYFLTTGICSDLHGEAELLKLRNTISSLHLMIAKNAGDHEARLVLANAVFLPPVQAATSHSQWLQDLAVAVCFDFGGGMSQLASGPAH